MLDTDWVELTADEIAATGVTFEWTTLPGQRDGVVESIQCSVCLTLAAVSGESGRGVCRCGATWLVVGMPAETYGPLYLDMSGVRVGRIPG